jgi:L-asparaginase / beta-aspartyl-peptidase
MPSKIIRAAAATAVLVAACSPAPRTGDMPAATGPAPVADVPQIRWGLVMHGGAGTITPESMTPELEAEYREKMSEALRAGHGVLANGGSSLDAVVAAIVILEDSPLFNAGKGAVFTADGTNSLDASIMVGSTLQAGAVAGVTTIKNPITLARRVMEASPHVLLAGDGAEAFAAEQGIEGVDPSYFHTDRRWRQLEAAKDAERHGTVGVVALDRSGAIAAGTSTGGMTNKKWGRVGDSPIIGAGTYANERCGVSSTGWGEYFIRNVVAYDICARMEYKGISLQEAAHEVIMRRLEAQEDDTGGIVALDGAGHIVMTFNTPGMYRGYADQDGNVVTEIYR